MWSTSSQAARQVPCSTYWAVVVISVASGRRAAHDKDLNLVWQIHQQDLDRREVAVVPDPARRDIALVFP
jgi:hypothetical protein